MTARTALFRFDYFRGHPVSIVFEIIRSVREAVLSRMERMLVVARRMLCLTTGPGFRFTSPASSRAINANDQ